MFSLFVLFIFPIFLIFHKKQSPGKNDHLITVDNYGPVWPMAPGSAWKDKEYTNVAWTGADTFVYSDELPGGNDEKDLDKESSDGDAEAMAEAEEAKADENV